MQSLRRILYYENDIDVLTETKFSLEEKGGFDVYAFENFEASLGQLNSLQPNIILLSAELSGFSGIELLHKLRKLDNLVKVPAVFYTRQNLDENILSINDVGLVDVLQKPMRGSDLIIKLHEIWGQFNESC